MVLVVAGVGRPRLDRPPVGRPRPAARPTQPDAAAARRRRRLLARRGHRRRRAAAAAGRDEAARAGPGSTSASSTTTPTATLFHQRAVFAPKGLWGRALLVVGVPVPRDRLRRHAAQHRPPGRASGRSPSADGPHRRRHRHDRWPLRDGAEAEPDRRVHARKRAEVGAVPGRDGGDDAVAIRRPVELVATTVSCPGCGRRAGRCGPPGRRSSPTSGWWRCAGAPTAAASRGASRRPTASSTSRGPPWTSSRPGSRVATSSATTTLVELVDAGDVVGDLLARGEQHAMPVGVLDHGVGDRAERRRRPVPDDEPGARSSCRPRRSRR